jgi:hypothetical protein
MGVFNFSITISLESLAPNFFQVVVVFCNVHNK